MDFKFRPATVDKDIFFHINKINLFNKAVWRSDRKDKLFLTIPNHRNTGSGSVIWGTTGQEVDTISLDDIILNITENGRKRIRLIKIDCEGAEFPILLTSKILHLVDNICGEYHEFGDQIPENRRVKE